MSHIVINRCPDCPSIRAHTENLVDALGREMGVRAAVRDGAHGELSVLVDGVPMLQRTGGSLPSVEEVEAAIGHASTRPGP